MSDAELSDALTYARRLYERVVDWYKNADAKAQIILTLDGAFLTFLTTSIFQSPDELTKITQRFNHGTWLCLLAMCLCLIGSIVSALMCLWSRIFFAATRDRVEA